MVLYADGPTAVQTIGIKANTDVVWPLVSEPGRCFEWAVGDLEVPAAVWAFEIEELNEANCRLTFRAKMGPGRSGVSETIEGIKALAEAK